jgi:hypothetical protein
MSHPSRSRSRGFLSSWAGESLGRRFVAWLVQSAILLAVAAIGFAIIWFVFMPWMIDGLTRVFTR